MHLPLLSGLILIPFLGAMVILLLPSSHSRLIKSLSLLATLVPLGISIFLCLSYVLLLPSIAPQTFCFQEKHAWLPQFGIQYFLGADGLTLIMLLLTGILGFSAALISFSLTFRVKEYFCLFLTALAGVFGIFSSLDLFFFILFYELASIPIYFLIGIWGSDKISNGKTVSKSSSALKLMLYLQLGGGLVLLGLLGLYFIGGARSFDYVTLSAMAFNPHLQLWLFPLLFVAFGIEAGLFPFHTWLPDGHSAAPSAISMLLAGVLLKMGSYGIIRIAIGLLPEGAAFWGSTIAVLAVINILYGAFCALKQRDLKYLIAYSSISHMGIVFLGAIALTPMALTGAWLQMFSHGILTALLFALAGLIYDRTHTRAIPELGGLARSMPWLATVFVIAGLGSLGLPGLSGFVAEFLVFMGSFKSFPLLTVLAAGSIVITAVYLLRAIQHIFMGQTPAAFETLKDVAGVEKLPLILLTLTAALAGCMPSLLLVLVNPGVQAMIIKIGGMSY